MASLLTVILNWRTADMTLRSAEMALAAMEGITGSLTIVDNDSQDGSFETLSAVVAERGWDKGPHAVRVLQSGHNGGFGAGNNFGMKQGLPAGISASTRPDYVYLLNSDAFPEKGAIAALIDHLERNPKTGLAGSYIQGEDGVPHRTAFRFPSAAGEFESHIRFGPVSKILRDHIIAAPLPQRSQPTDWLVGASLMMRQDMLDQIGLFDETFFLYFEETDLCRRAALAGWPSDYVLESRVMHIGSVSTGLPGRKRIPRYWLDSRLYYFSKNHGRFGALSATMAALMGGALWRARLLIQKKDRAEPPGYLRDLISHHLCRGFRFSPRLPNGAKAVVSKGKGPRS